MVRCDSAVCRLKASSSSFSLQACAQTAHTFVASSNCSMALRRAPLVAVSVSSTLRTKSPPNNDKFPMSRRFKSLPGEEEATEAQELEIAARAGLLRWYRDRSKGSDDMYSTSKTISKANPVCRLSTACKSYRRWVPACRRSAPGRIGSLE